MLTKAKIQASSYELIFSLVFCLLAIAAPWILHHFNMAGPRFLPINFFVILATLLLGWRSGLVVGVFSLLISFEILKMPPVAILPRIFIEMLCLIILIDYFKFKKRLSNLKSSILSIISAKAVIVFVIAISTFKLLQVKSIFNELFVLAWPGILLQILLIPLLLLIITKLRARNG